MPKRFTLEEAQGLLPQLEPLVERAVLSKREYDAAERAIEAFGERITLMGGVMVDRQQAVDVRSRREHYASELREAVASVQQFGCVLKDLDTGLLDFPTLLRGVEVCLCWKLGETAIAFWHGTDEGFRGRKAIDQDFRDHHRGDPPH